MSCVRAISRTTFFKGHLQVDVVFHQPHPGVTWPALLVVVAHNVLIVGVRVLREVPLNQISGLVSREPEKCTTDEAN